MSEDPQGWSIPGARPGIVQTVGYTWLCFDIRQRLVSQDESIFLQLQELVHKTAGPH